MTWHLLVAARGGRAGLVARSAVAPVPPCRVEPLEGRTLLTAVTAVLVNGADAAAAGVQRSVIQTISARFDTNARASVQSADLRLWNATARQFINTSAATVSYNDATNTATWTFPTQGGAAMLPDGNYRATLLSMTVYDTAGNPLDGNGDGVGGDEYSFNFHRLFGDSDGDRDVDSRDAIRQRRSRGRSPGHPFYNPAFDYNGDGAVSPTDTVQFRRRLGRRLRPDAGNSPPVAPVIEEPATDGQVINGQDLHMQIQQPFVDADNPAPDPLGANRSASDFEVWTRGLVPERVFYIENANQFDSKVHQHFGDGVFAGSHAGRTSLLPDTNYLLRIRHRDTSGDPGTTNSNWAVRLFRTLPPEPVTADGWVALQPGYQVQELPFDFGGQAEWSLPVNIAFVPQARRGPNPSDPLFYVNELYGNVRVVTNDFHVHTYASGLLNYSPFGGFGGPGENGLTGIVVDPSNGDVYVTMLYDPDPDDGDETTFPKVTRFTSTDGGLHAVDTNGSEVGTQGTDILRMPDEPMRQSHIISNISFGPDDKLYVHVGDGFDASAGQNDDVFRGKILRINRNGTPVTDNPRYNAADGITARDYVYAIGLRNPFGGAWRDANPSAGTPAQHFTVENGPSRDRLSMLVRDRNYLYDGSDESMNNFNIAYSPTGTFENGAPDWTPAPAPVNITFVQPSVYAGSGFPAEKQGHAFVAQSGGTFGAGPQGNAKMIEEWVLNPDGTRRVSAPGEARNPRPLVKYEGPGRHTAAALAAGPGGLFFSTLYPDDTDTPWDPGAKIYRIAFVGEADFTADVTAGDAPLTVRFTDLSEVPGATTWHWEFGDGTSSHDRNPTHVYTANGSYNVRLTVTGPNGDATATKREFVVVGTPGVLPNESEPNDARDLANNAVNNAQPFAGQRFQMSLAGEISPGADRDWFRVGSMQAGDVVVASLSGVAGARGSLPNGLVRLYRANDGSAVEVASNDNGGPGNDALLRFAVTTADTYYVVADSANDAAGSYELGLWLENGADTPQTGGSLRNESGANDSAAAANDAASSWRAVTSRSTTAATLSAGDADFYRFQFNAGELVTVVIDSTSVADARVTLRNSAGGVLAQEDGTSDGQSGDSPIYAFFVPGGGTYYLEVRATAGAGPYTAEVYLSPPVPGTQPANPPVPGVRGEYYDTMDLSGPALVRIEPNIDFDYGLGSPDPSIDGETFSARWTGQIQAPGTGTYDFHTFSDDGVRLWVNGVPVIDNWTDHPPTEDVGSISLVAGQWYDLRMEFYENGIGAVARLSWEGPNQPLDVVAESQLRTTAGLAAGLGLRLEFEETGGGVANDSSGNFNHGNLRGGVTRIADSRFGRGLRFDGTDDYVVVPAAPLLNPRAAFTVSAWVRADTWLGGDRTILSKPGAYRLGNSGGLLRFEVAGPTGVNFATGLLPSRNAWHHVVASYDGARVKLFVDGTLVQAAVANGLVAASAEPLYVGTRSAEAPAGNFFDGLIDDVRLYGRALSDAEIVALSQGL